MSEPDVSDGELRESAPVGSGEGGPRVVTAPQQTLPTVTEPLPEPEPDWEFGEDPDPSASFEGLDVEARRQWSILREHAREPSPPPRSGKPVDELVWGLAQPLLGVRTLVGHGDLFVRGLIPAAAFVLVCALIVDYGEVDGLWGAIAAFYGVLVGAVSVSPIVFCRNYSKLAAEARRYLDVPRHEPYLRSFKQAIGEALAQAIVLGIGVAPVVAAISWLPLVGGIAAAIIGWLWIVHWIVVEALDSARTLAPDQTPETIEQRHAKLDPPWYAATIVGRMRGPLSVALLPIRLWGIVMARLGQRWRGEVALIEARPWLAVGFGLGASLLLLIPVVNLLVRPAIVVAASHVLGRLEGA